MPTSAPGNKPTPHWPIAHWRGRNRRSGFTLLELLIVVTVIALATGLSVLALRDPAANRLEQEAARLVAVLEAARMDSRASGQVLTFRPVNGGMATGGKSRVDFVFEPGATRDDWPQRWLHAQTQAEVIGASRLILGPEPLIPPQRLVLRLGQEQRVVATDGLGAFRVEEPR